MARKNIESFPATTCSTFIAERLIGARPRPAKPRRPIGIIFGALLLNAIIFALSAPAGAQSLNWYKRAKLFLDPEAAQQFAAVKRARAGADSGFADKSPASFFASEPLAGPSAFSPPTTMSTQRIGHAAVKLLDGRVLVTGGIDNTLAVLSSAELYNPNTNSWAAAAPMNVARSVHTATRLLDGRVLVVGGADDDDNSLVTTEIYNPNTNTWTFAAPLNTKRDTHAAVLLSDTNNGNACGCKVLVAGGQTLTNTAGTFSGGPLNTSEIYDPAANTWSFSFGVMAQAREAHTMTLLTNGRVLVTGGDTYTLGPPFIETTRNTAEVYDPVSGFWGSLTTMSTPRVAHTATRLLTGNVLVTGGTNFSRDDTACAPDACDGTFTSLSSAEIYDVNGASWSGAAPLPQTREDHSASLLPSGRVLVAAGELATPPLIDHTLNTTVLYNPTGNSWAADVPMTTSRDGHTATVLGNRQILIAGGESYNCDDPNPCVVSVLSSAELYTPDGPTLSVSPSTVGPGGTVTVTWSGIVSPTTTDWIGLYTAENPSETNWVDWVYVSCSRTAGAAAASGSCPFVIPANLATGFYEFRLYANNNYTRLATTNPLTVQNLPVVTIVATDNSATEGPGVDTGTFTVTRSGGAISQPLTVNYTVGGSATPGVGPGVNDYETLPGSVIIPGGSTSALITVTPHQDGTTFEGDETVIVTLSANAAYTVGSPSSAFVTIHDDDPAPPTVTIFKTADAAEPSTNGTFRVDRTGATGAALTVNYTVGGSATPNPTPGQADYTTLPGSVTIPIGSSSATITVAVGDDVASEGTETVIVTLTANPSVYTVGSPASATVNIADNDGGAPPPAISSTPANIPSSGGTETVVVTNIPSPTTTDWIGLYTPAAANTAYIDWIYVGSCTKSAGPAVPGNTCPFSIPGSLANGTYQFRLLAANGYTSLATGNNWTKGGAGTPVVTIVKTADAAEPSTNGSFTVSRTDSTAAALTVNYTVGGTATPGAAPGGGNDYATLPVSVTIPIGSPSAVITVTVFDDAAGEPTETVIVTLAAGAYTIGSPSSATVNIVDDDVPTVTIVKTQDAAEPATNGIFTVNRTGPTAAALTVNYSVGGSATPNPTPGQPDYTTLPGSVTIPIGSSSATITVAVGDDVASEGTETVIVTLTANFPTYSVGVPSSATVNIVDNDGPFINEVPNPVTRGSAVTATWGGVASPTSKDWIGLYTAPGTSGSFWDWIYDSSCTKTAGAPAASGSCPFTIPATVPPGSYVLRLFTNDTFTELAKTAPFTVSP